MLKEVTHKIVCAGMCTQCVCCVCPGEHGRSKSNFQERVPSFHPGGSEDQTQVTGLDEESFPAEPFHHLTSIVLKKGCLDISNIKKFELVQFTISTKNAIILLKCL